MVADGCDQAGGRREGQAQGSADGDQRANGAHTFAGEYFAEEVRREIFERYGEKKLYEGGLSVRTTLDTEDSGDGAQDHGRRPGQL